MNREDSGLPALPQEVRAALRDVRDITPNAALERRLWRAIEAAERSGEGSASERPGRLSIPFGLVMAGVLAAAIVAMID